MTAGGKMHEKKRGTYYAGLRLEAEIKVLENQSKILSDQEILTTLEIISGYEVLLVSNKDEKEEKEIKARIAKHIEKVKVLMADKGLTIDDLKPQYRCKKCSDTGFTNDGCLCDCFYD